MYNVIKKKTWSCYLLGDLLLSGGGVTTFGGSLFSGFIRSHNVLTLLSEGRYYRNFTRLTVCMSPLATGHPFCASSDGPRKSDFLGRCLLKQRSCCTVYKYTGKASLGKGYWDTKRKLGVTTHFSKIVKFQFGEKCHTFLCILALFGILVA